MNFRELLKVVKLHLADLTTVDEPDFRLEEAEFKSEQGVWEVVVSFLVENRNRRTKFENALNVFPYDRIYKRLSIDDKKKEILGLYMYNDR